MRRNEVEARREKVASLILEHKSIRVMAAEIGVSPTTIHHDLSTIRAEWQRHRLDVAEQAISEDIKRLEAMEQALWPKVMDADLLAIDRLLRIMERRAKLLGLDAPKRIDITERIRRIAEDAGLDPDEAIIEAQRIVRALP